MVREVRTLLVDYLCSTNWPHIDICIDSITVMRPSNPARFSQGSVVAVVAVGAMVWVRTLFSLRMSFDAQWTVVATAFHVSRNDDPVLGDCI
jgi:hypothetical protein